MIWGTVADRVGRRSVYLYSFPIFFVGSLLAGFSLSYPVLFTLRILQAIGASSVQSVGGGTIADIFEPKERGSAMGIFLVMIENLFFNVQSLAHKWVRSWDL